MWDEQTLLMDDVQDNTGVIVEATRSGVQIAIGTMNSCEMQGEFSIFEILKGMMAAWVVYIVSVVSISIIDGK